MSSEWTISTLKEHFEAILLEKNKALDAALAAAKEAVAVAEKNAEKWRDNANEWRSAMNDREKNFVGKAEYETYKDSTEKALKTEKERGDTGAGKEAGISKANASIIGLILLGIAISGFLINLYSKH